MFLLILCYRYFSKLYFSDCKLIDHHIDSANSNNNNNDEYKLVTDNDNDDQHGISIVNDDDQDGIIT